ncbi:hypothetical protein PBY51_023054 [Eleginops maclovinus]|uniref:Uncharacterized protein n=1 Tax=Eleginops maclovinus TaxID=56733 RepID=A0AAN7WY17_ELEMC|nr:hypothetical protein PBY51_023054 [Eleginops maclovinus]
MSSHSPPLPNSRIKYQPFNPDYSGEGIMENNEEHTEDQTCNVEQHEGDSSRLEHVASWLSLPQMKPLPRVHRAAAGGGVYVRSENVSKRSKSTLKRPHPGREATELQETSRGAFVVVVCVARRGFAAQLITPHEAPHGRVKQTNPHREDGRAKHTPVTGSVSVCV